MKESFARKFMSLFFDNPNVAIEDYRYYPGFLKRTKDRVMKSRPEFSTVLSRIEFSLFSEDHDSETNSKFRNAATKLKLQATSIDRADLFGEKSGEGPVVYLAYTGEKPSKAFMRAFSEAFLEEVEYL